MALKHADCPSLLNPVFFKSDNFDCFAQECVRNIDLSSLILEDRRIRVLLIVIRSWQRYENARRIGSARRALPYCGASHSLSETEEHEHEQCAASDFREI